MLWLHRVILILILLMIFMASTAGAQDNSIEFSGYTWQISHAPDGKSPGPNPFLNNPKTVKLDGKGRLRLTIDQIEGVWSCSELRLNQTLGYGQYEIHVLSDPNTLDRNTVFGFFTYDYDSPPHFREIDIEFARWSDPDHPGGNFTVQPYQEKNNSVTFPLSNLGTDSIHRITWIPDRILFEALRQTDTGRELIFSWVWEGRIQPGNTSLHLNFWLFRGKHPSDEKRQMMIIESFSFTPLDEVNKKS